MRRLLLSPVVILAAGEALQARQAQQVPDLLGAAGVYVARYETAFATDCSKKT